jgi:hypothetical protein
MYARPFYEEYVGSRTTHDLVNHHHARELATQLDITKFRFLNLSAWAYTRPLFSST